VPAPMQPWFARAQLVTIAQPISLSVEIDHAVSITSLSVMEAGIAWMLPMRWPVVSFSVGVFLNFMQIYPNIYLYLLISICSLE